MAETNRLYDEWWHAPTQYWADKVRCAAKRERKAHGLDPSMAPIFATLARMMDGARGEDRFWGYFRAGTSIGGDAPPMDWFPFTEARVLHALSEIHGSTVIDAKLLGYEQGLGIVPIY